MIPRVSSGRDPSRQWAGYSVLPTAYCLWCWRLLMACTGEIAGLFVVIALDPAGIRADGVDQRLLVFGAEQHSIYRVFLNQVGGGDGLPQINIVAPLIIGIQLDARIGEHWLLGCGPDQVRAKGFGMKQ